MKLQTALILNSLASLLLVLVWVPLSNVARETFNDALEAQIASSEVLQDFVELNEATRELTINSSTEGITNWRRKYDLASIRLLPQYFRGSTEELILDSIQTDYRNLKQEFENLASLLQIDTDPATDPLLLNETREQLSILSDTSHSILQEVIFYTELRQTQLNTASQGIDVYRSATIVGAFVAITLINYLIYRSIARPVRSLTNVAAEISKGNVHAKLDKTDLPQFGEFGQLADAFVEMTERIEDLYSNLEDKVVDKTKALSHTVEEIQEEKEKFERQVIETEMFRQAVQSATDGILIVKVDGEIVYSNIAWAKISGYTPKELIGENIRVLQSQKSDEQIYNKIWQGMISLQDVTVEELVNKRKDGDYYQAQIAVYPIKENGNPTYYVCMQQDITKRKEVDKAKTEFVSLASHQLRTPLSTIGWYAEMLMSGDAGNLNDDQRKLMEEIISGNQRMINLVNALLNVSRLELGTFSVDAKWTNIIDLTENIIKELQHEIDTKNLNLETNFDNRLPDIKTDPNLMRIVIQNLISNAVKYTASEGHIKVSVHGDIPPTQDVDRDAFSNIIIEVQDDGMGIPGRQQDQVFTKLFRADNVKETDTEGTGLGLYLVKSIVDYAEGEITFESSENEGTKFKVKLPVKGMAHKDGTKGLITEMASQGTAEESLS